MTSKGFFGGDTGMQIPDMSGVGRGTGRQYSRQIENEFKSLFA